MTSTELKAKAYDLIALGEQVQRELQKANAEISEALAREEQAKNPPPSVDEAKPVLNAVPIVEK
jgi:hypothetical protein